MAKKNNETPTIDKKTRKALTETKVNINDGWADDVPIVYNEDNWMPEDADLTMVKIDALEGKHHRRIKHTALEKNEPESQKPVSGSVPKAAPKTDAKAKDEDKPIPALASKTKKPVKQESKPAESSKPAEPKKAEKPAKPEKPETQEKPKLSLEEEARLLEDKKKKEKKAQIEKEIKKEDISKIIEEESTVKKTKKVHPFRLFLIIWLGTLSITIAILLAKFYSFLEKYEEAYQASRPYHTMDTLMQDFNALNINELYNLMTVKPVTNEFETEENVKNYMLSLLSDKAFSYSETQSSTKELPEFYVAADGYIVAKVDLRKVVGETMEYSFPKWYISSFELYTDAQYSVRVEIPSNYSISVNGIKLSDEYAYETNIAIDDEEYFENYIDDFPTLTKYYCTGFYEEPDLYAINCFGTEADIEFNTSRGIYEVPFSLPDNFEEIAEYATQVVTDYAFFISQDAGDNALDKYFPEGEELLNMIKASTSRQYFTKHSDTYMDNVQLNDFIMYTPNCVYIGITMDQHLIMWSGDEIVPINGNFCYVKIDGEWKVCAIKY